MLFHFVKLVYFFVAWVLLFLKLDDSGGIGFFLATFMFVGSISLDELMFLKEDSMTKILRNIVKFFLIASLTTALIMVFGITGGLLLTEVSPIEIRIADGGFIDNFPVFRKLEPLLSEVGWISFFGAVADFLLGYIIDLAKIKDKKADKKEKDKE